MPDFFEWIAACLISVVLGHFVIGPIMYVIRRTVGIREKVYEWMLFWIGGTERAVATTLVIWAPNYVAPFIGAWIAFKLAASWQRVPSSLPTRQGTLLALVGSSLSFAFAICVGVLVHPEALMVWTK